VAQGAGPADEHDGPGQGGDEQGGAGQAQAEAGQVGSAQAGREQPAGQQPPGPEQGQVAEQQQGADADGQGAADGQPGPQQQAGGGAGQGVVGPQQRVQGQSTQAGEGDVLGVHKHVAVEDRGQAQKQGRQQPGQGAAEVGRQLVGAGDPDQPDQRVHQVPTLVKTEREQSGCQVRDDLIERPVVFKPGEAGGVRPKRQIPLGNVVPDDL